MYCGVGIYISSNINNVQVLANILVENTYLCPKCEIQSLFLYFSYMNEGYRQSNGVVNHFINNLENALVKIDDKMSITIAGDINIDLFNLRNTIRYPTTLLPNQYLPYVKNN